MLRTNKCPSSALKGFTLIELLVCISIISLLLTLFLPALQTARNVTRIAVCASNMRQQGMLIGQYAADIHDFLPQPTTGHGIINNLFVGGNAIMAAGTGATGASSSCPEWASDPYPTYRLMPLGPGWFYYMGYLPPTVKQGKLGCLVCPDSPYVARFKGPWVFGYDTATSSVNGISALTTLWSGQTYTGLATGLNFVSASYDCLANNVPTDYCYRGWARTAISTATPRYSSWNSSNAYVVDREHYDSAAAGNALPSSPTPISPYFLDVHGDGVNIMFADGHVNFGGKNLVDNVHGNGVLPPYVYYNVQNYTAYSYTGDWGIGGGGANSGYTGGGQSKAYMALWSYYETGIP